MRSLWFALAVLCAVPATTVTSVSPTVSAAAPGAFRPVVPIRVLDTRTTATPFGPATTRTLDLSQRAPAGATAVVLNLTAVGPTARTYLTVWPTGSGRPPTSNLNAPAGVNRPNAVVVGLGTGRSIDIFNAFGRVDVVADVTGWMTGTAFTGIRPHRALDTRDGAALGTQRTRTVRVAGVGGVPADAAAVAVNLTATGATTNTFLTAWPTGAARPATSNLNVAAQENRANLAVLAVGDDGTIDVFNAFGTTDVVVDLLGFFPDASVFTGLVPERLLDTRARTCGFRLGPGETRTITVDDDPTVRGAVLNVTAVAPTQRTYLTVWPTGSSRPVASSLNTDPSVRAAPNTVLTGLGSFGQVNVFNAFGFVDVVVDITGTFTGTRTDGPLPVPCLDGPPAATRWVAPQSVLPAETPLIGQDVVAMWKCVESGPGASNPVAIDLDQLGSMLNVYVSGYFLTESQGRYRPIFVNAGTVQVAPGSGEYRCLGAALDASGWPYTNALVFDATSYGLFGFAGSGFPAPTNRLPTAPISDRSPSQTARGGYVSGGNVASEELTFGRDFGLIAHELGHTLAWPHSFSGSVLNGGFVDEYDNVFDLMSGASTQLYFACMVDGAILFTEYCQAGPTMVANRIAAGWLDAADIATHTGGTTSVRLGDAAGGADIQAVVAPSDRTPGQFVTVEAYTPERDGFRFVGDPVLYGTNLPKGVAVHVVQGAQQGLARRQYQASREPYTDRHILQPGEQLTVAGLTVSVTTGRTDSYDVVVSGTYAGLPV